VTPLRDKVSEALDEAEGTAASSLSPPDDADSVAIAIPDNTRPLSYEDVLPPLLSRLDDPGLTVTVVVGNGLHRPMNDEELEPVRRACRRSNIDLVQHDAGDDEEIARVEYDVASDQIGWPTLPAFVNRHVYEADHVVTIGTVEPHQYAGFSGGAKGIAIGCGGEETISAMHGLEFLRDEGTKLGVTERNPFQQAVWRLIDWTDAPRGLQIVPASGDQPPLVYAGALREAYDDAVDAATHRFFDPVDQTYDWLELDIPDEKATNFYQASRAATYAALVDDPAIARGGTLIVNAACPEGIGRGSGERACAEALARGPERLLQELDADRRIETRGGQQRAYVVAQTMARHDIVLVGADHHLELLEDIGIQQFETAERARAALGLNTTNSTGRRIRDIFHAIPVRRAPDRSPE